jgi:hypothetical protein
MVFVGLMKATSALTRSQALQIRKQSAVNVRFKILFCGFEISACSVRIVIMFTLKSMHYYFYAVGLDYSLLKIVINYSLYRIV